MREDTDWDLGVRPGGVAYVMLVYNVSWLGRAIACDECTCSVPSTGIFLYTFPIASAMIGDRIGKQLFVPKLMCAFLNGPLLLMILGVDTGITAEIHPRSMTFSPLTSIMKLSH